jgi:opacity protein-like surface antigen
MRVPYLGISIACLMLGIAGPSLAANPDDQGDPWTGFYGGVSASVGFGNSDSTLDFVRSGAIYHESPESPSRYSAGASRALGGLQLGYDQRQGRFVLGGELDLSAGGVSADARGRGISSGATHAGYDATAMSTLDRLATLRGQAGYLATDGLLLYGFAGLAVGRVNNSTGLAFTTGVDYQGNRPQTLAGWTAGFGVEYLFAPSLGLKVEYLHYDLGTATVDARRQSLSPYHTQAGFDAGGDIIRIAVDYHLGDAFSLGADDGSPLGTVGATLAGFSYEAGARYWGSTGTTRWELHGYTPSLVNSRLSFTGLDANSGEVFGRTDHPSGVFARATVGAGAVGGGDLTDEDFPPGTDPASRTDSAQRNGAISYVTADGGYTIFDIDGIQLAPFVGYAYYHDQLNTYGCRQLGANPSICNGYSTQALAISEDADWNALRLGLSGRWKTGWHGLRLDVDAAWVPYGQLDGNDDHWLRLHTQSVSQSLAGPILQSGVARGLQLEAMAKMPLTDRVDLGLGGRYWYLYSRGNTLFQQTFFATRPQATDFSVRRVGGLLQISVHF